MQCCQCQHDNPSDAKFCNQCAAPLAPVCIACGHENPANAKFCTQCSNPLVATTSAARAAHPGQQETESERQLQVGLRVVIAILHRERRVSYRTIKYLFGFDDALLGEIRRELVFKEMAIDKDGEGLVWIGETQPPSYSVVPAPISLADPDPATDTSSLLSHHIETDTLSNEPIIASEPIRSVPEAERRQLTVMFCDLVGSTDLSGQLDPEDLREVVRAYQETAAEVIQRYEGHIAQYLGDGLLIYFGYPIAHEDDAQRAVYTGLGIPEAMATLNTRLEAEYGVQLAVRIGIHTGAVVVGEMGGGGRQENLALGETPNIAARLEGLAQPNTAVISPITVQLVQRSFVLEELGPHELKGVAEPMMLYTVVAQRETEYDDHEEMLDGGFGALVGRDEEIGLLLRRWEQSKEGQGQVALISGEAGIGKSSLVEGLRSHVRQEGHTRLAIRCSPYHTNSALYPIIDHVQRALRWQLDDTGHTKLAKLEQALESTSLAPHEAVPLMASFLSLELPEERYPAMALNPQQQRQQTQDMLVAWLQAEAERQPVLAVWEDLHWADPSTLEVLGLVLEEAATAPMLHMLTFRPEFQPPWATRSHMTPITLNRLERSQVEAMITHLARGKALPTEVLEHIVAKTDGVPLYVEELTKMLMASDLLKEQTDRYVLSGVLTAVAIPDTLQDSLMARLDQMHTAKEVAQLGSVLGREFAYEMIEAIASQDPETLQSGLGQLVQAELLYQRGRPPRARYIFKHALIQDAAYASLLKSTRYRVHQHIAQLWETQFPETVEAEPEWVAHHYTAAGCSTDAIPYWQRAGERALAVYAPEEAMSHFQRGLALKEEQPQDAETAALRFGLGRAQASILPGHQIREAVASLSHAFDYYMEAGEVDRAVAIAEYPVTTLAGQQTGMTQLITRVLTLVPSDSHAAGRLLSRYVKTMGTEEGEYDKAQEAVSRALTIAQREGDLALEVRTLVDAANVDMLHRRWPACAANSLRAIELARQAEAPYAEVAARFWAAGPLIYMGEPEAAQRHGAAMLALAERLRDRWWLTSALLANAAVSWMLGDWLEAQEFIDRGLAVLPMDPRLLGFRIMLAYEMGDVTLGALYLDRLLEALHITEPGPSLTFGFGALVIPLVAQITGEVDRLDTAEVAGETLLSSPLATPTITTFARYGMGLLSVLRGDTASVAEHYVALSSERGTVIALGLAAVDRLLGLLAQTMGNLEQAMEHFEEALAFCHKASYQSETAWTCYDYAAALLRRNGPADQEKAVSRLHESLAISNELGMCPLQAHCHRSLGTLYSQTGQVEQARSELSTAIEMYRDVEMTFWLPETEAMLAEVEKR